MNFWVHSYIFYFIIIIFSVKIYQEQNGLGRLWRGSDGDNDRKHHFIRKLPTATEHDSGRHRLPAGSGDSDDDRNHEHSYNHNKSALWILSFDNCFIRILSFHLYPARLPQHRSSLEFKFYFILKWTIKIVYDSSKDMNYFILHVEVILLYFVAEIKARDQD